LVNDMEDFLNVGYFKMARQASQYSDHRVKVGAVLCNKRPIGFASNRVRTHPLYANPHNSIRGSIHAEIRAVLNSNKEDLSRCTMFIYRGLKNGKPAMAKPCPHCLEFLRSRGLKRIYYTVDSFPYYRKEDL